jgi:hypothetical protein
MGKGNGILKNLFCVRMLLEEGFSDLPTFSNFTRVTPDLTPVEFVTQTGSLEVWFGIFISF